MDRTITQSLRREIAERIKVGIEKRLFGQGEDHIRMVKIVQNIELGTTALLGKPIRSDRIDTFIQLYIDQYIRAVVRVGEAVGVIAAQSLNQPIVQSVLKSQHRTGTKETSAANSLVILNKMSVAVRIIKVHPAPVSEMSRGRNHHATAAGWLAQQDLQTLARLYEEVKLDDVLSSTYGNSKYTPEQADEFYSQELTHMYINHRHTHVGEIVYRFRLDPSKLEDAGLNPFDIFELLTEIKGVMVVLHPLSTFIFDLVPGGKPLTAFLEMIKKLMNRRLKGIPGLASISERKVSTTQLVPHSYYDEEKDETYLYLNASAMTLFPVDQLKKRVKQVEPVSQTPSAGARVQEDRDPKVIHEVTRLHHRARGSEMPSSYELFHLVYRGRVTVEKSDYTYYLFMGTLSVEDLLNHRTTLQNREIKFGELVDRRYLVSNDPHEMIDMLGKTSARTIHEYNYSEELRSSETPLLYQHINTVCREMFGVRTNPITPVSYMRSKETNALDKFAYQNYRQNLEREIIKGNRSTNEEIPSAILTGRRAKLGTGYVRTVVDNQRRQEVIILYSEARQRQKYFGEYKDIEIPKLGELRPITTFTAYPFGKEGLPNRGVLGI